MLKKETNQEKTNEGGKTNEGTNIHTKEDRNERKRQQLMFGQVGLTGTIQQSRITRLS